MAVAADMGGFWRHVTGDSQLRWIGPDKGAMHLATAAVVNAAWDLAAGKPTLTASGGPYTQPAMMGGAPTIVKAPSTRSRFR